MTDPAEPERDVTKDPVSAHEVLDRVSIVAMMFEQFVLEHPFVRQTPDLSARAEYISEKLGSLYQLAGSVSFRLDEELAPRE